MTFAQLYGAQLDIELGSADRSQLFQTARRKKAVNDAMHNWERVTGGTPVFGTIPIQSGVGEYDLFLNFQNYISLADNAQPSLSMADPNNKVTWVQGDSFPRRDPVWLDAGMPGWRSSPASTPMAWYLRNDGGSTFIGMTPSPLIPASWTYTLLVPYLGASDDMVSDGDQPFTFLGTPFARLAPYHQALVHYAAALLEPLRKNYTAAKRQMDLYAGYLAQYSTKERKDGPDQVTFARNYLREATGASMSGRDPHRWP